MKQSVRLDQPKQPSVMMKRILNLLISGTSGSVALSIVYPMESIKTMIQLKSEAGEKASISKIASERMKTEGFRTLYKGLPAALIRQFFFASIRLGLFFNFGDYFKSKNNRSALTIMESTVSSLGAAAIGISAVMPFDVIFVRFQAENALPPSQRRGYTGVGNAVARIIKEEGIKALWRGILPGIARAMALNFGMLVPYEQCKAVFAPHIGWNYTNYLCSAAIAGLCSTICCLPFDNVKVKLQKMKPDQTGKLPYKGLIDCFVKSVKTEGIGRLWSAFLPFYLFVSPHTMLTLLMSDGLRIVMGVSKN